MLYLPEDVLNNTGERRCHSLTSWKKILSGSLLSFESLWLLYKTIPAGHAPAFRELAYARARNKSVSYTEITLVTQASTNKLFRLVQLLDHWNGPISCAVYLPSEESIQDLFSFVESQNQLFHNMVTLHTLLERLLPGFSSYPINRLRNLALENIDTEYFFYVDIDFMPSTNMHKHLKDFFIQNKEPKRFSTLYVIPAFELNRGIHKIPGSQGELLDMISRREAQGFHMDHFSPGHNSTNFNQWYSCHTNGTYPIQYQYMFEPYVAGSRYGLHRFDDRFRGYGFNKWTWVAEANFRGYNFEVLCGVFLVHMTHKHNAQRKIHTKIVELQYWYEKIYWPIRYNITIGHHVE